MAKKRKTKIKYNRVFLLITAFVMLVASITWFIKENAIFETFEKKAVWISYLNMETLKDKDEPTFRKNFTQMCENAKGKNLNTLIVHVRPFMDAMYQSEMYPMSTYISSDGFIEYDALKIMVDTAHSYDLKFEAWINPYRISYNEAQLHYFMKHSTIAKWMNSDKILISDYTAILNPASKDARDYIVSGVKEIIDQYDVDGIHMDDYFYASSLLHHTTKEERCENVNILVQQIYQTLKAKDPLLTFGISPQGNLDNARNIGADIDTWLSEDGYVDYVMPQIYWTDNWSADGTIEMFSTRVDAYNAIHTNHHVKLYAGLALYLAGQEVADDAGWSMFQDNLARQTAILNENDWKGYALFDYDSMLEQQTQTELNHLMN